MTKVQKNLYCLLSTFKKKDSKYSFLDPPHFILTKDGKKSHKTTDAELPENIHLELIEENWTI